MVGEPPTPEELKEQAQGLNDWIRFQEQLSHVGMPDLSFENTPFEDVLKTFQAECHKQAGIGFEIVFDPPDWRPEPLTLNLRNLTAAEALQIIAGVTGYGCRLQDGALLVRRHGKYVVEVAWRVKEEIVPLLGHLPIRFPDDEPLFSFVFDPDSKTLRYREDQGVAGRVDHVLRTLGLVEGHAGPDKEPDDAGKPPTSEEATRTYLRYYSPAILPDGTRLFGISIGDPSRSYRAKLGDTVKGFKLLKFEEKSTGPAESARDASVLTLEKDGRQIELIRHVPTYYQE
jgi:hypothetical protein